MRKCMQKPEALTSVSFSGNALHCDGVKQTRQMAVVFDNPSR